MAKHIRRLRRIGRRYNLANRGLSRNYRRRRSRAGIKSYRGRR